jgi:hypothetical protein
MCAPLIGPATVTATKTANAHPAVITIHPELLPFVFLERRLRLRYLVKGALAYYFCYKWCHIFVFEIKLFFNPVSSA